MKLCERAYDFIQIIDYKGTVRICGWIKDNTIGSLSEQSMQDIWLGDKANEIRNRLAACDYSKCLVDACPYCAMNTHDEHFIEVDKIPQYPPSLYLAFEEVCNYKCTSCTTPGVMENNRYRQEVEDGYRNIEEKLRDVLPHVKHISANGRGELFASKRTMKLLADWKPLSPAEECSVSLETNGSLFDEEHWNQISNLGQYDLTVSITIMSFDEKAYQQLSGTKLPISKIEDNLRFVKRLREEGVINHLELATVYQERNFRYLPEFTRRCIDEFGADEVRLRPYMPWGADIPEIEWFYDIRNPKHPYYREYVEIMKKPIFNNPKVKDWGGGLFSEHNCIAPWDNKCSGTKLFYKSAKTIAKKIGDNSAVIVGIGGNGKEFMKYAVGEGMNIVGIFDNSSKMNGKCFFGYSIEKPRKVERDDVYYVITPEIEVRNELKKQLLELGIQEKYILTYYSYREYGYMKDIPASEYKNEISDMYREKFGYDMDWDNPTTYNEIINYEKIYSNNPLRTILSDKCQVRGWVSDKIGNEYLTKQYGIWLDPDDIDFGMLPNSYVLKTNNGSGRNIIIRNRKDVDEISIKGELKEWLAMNFAYNSLEMHYKDIPPRIICEELLDTSNTEFYDCKVYCFHGKPMYVQLIKDEHMPNMRARFYDTDWNVMSFNHGYPNDKNVVSKPICMDELLEKTKVLCAGFDHVRVDWFMLSREKFLFSEMTFSSWSGLIPFVPNEYDEIFGNLIRKGL